jgi:ABC-type bacteriocin/lantibiotic exporter with double-glycine peptidase domain
VKELIKFLTSSIRLLDPKDVRKIYLTVPLFLLLALMDLAGVVLLGTVGTLSYRLISGDNKKARLELIINDLLNKEIALTTLVAILISVAIVILISKTVFQAVITYKFIRLQASIDHKLTTKIFNNILHKNVDKINQFAYSDYQYALTVASPRFIQGVVGTYVSIFSDLLSLILMSFFAFFASPISFITILIILCSVYFLTNGPVHKKAANYGREGARTGTKINALLLESFQGIKEIQVYKQESNFVNSFSKYKYNSSLVGNKQVWLAGLLRYFFEIAIVLSAAGVLVFLALTVDMRRAVTVAVVFMAIGFRAIPSIQRLQNSFVSLRIIKNSSLSLFQINEKFESPNIDIVENNKSFTKIKFVNLGFKYSNNLIFKNLDWEIKENSTTVIFGESGSGKTTLIDLLCGLYEPTSGDIQFFDNSDNLVLNPYNAIKIGYVSQNSALFDGNIYENVSFSSSCTEVELKRIDDILIRLGIKYLTEINSQGRDESIKSSGTNLSGGERQRVAIARSIFANPQLVVFDEPTSSLDIENKKKLFEYFLEIKGNKTVVIATHDQELIEHADFIIEIKNNEIYFSGTAEEYSKKNYKNRKI